MGCRIPRSTGFTLPMILALLFTTIDTGTGFLLTDDHCVAPPGICSCDDDDINCDYKHLKAVPKFQAKTFSHCENYHYSSISLDGNDIVSVPSHAFGNISFTCLMTNMTKFVISLSSNKINYIHPDAFAGIDNRITDVHLEWNNLEALPTALGNIVHLKLLSVEGNPLVSLDTSVLAHFDWTLNDLLFDMSHFKSNQLGLSDLHILESMSIYLIPYSHLPLTAFDGLLNLTKLLIKYSELERIPASVCNLHNLKVLRFQSNTALDNDISIFETCSPPLMNLFMLDLRNNSMENFPDVLTKLPLLEQLLLEENDIHFIPDDVIPYSHGLRKLMLNWNKLTRIPSAILRLTNLTTLGLASNRIMTVEANDFLSLSQLHFVTLDDNPIEYIAIDAFKNSQNIDLIGLSNITLHLIPKAVIMLPRLDSFFFENNDVECSCRMSYLKGWNVTGIFYFPGSCKGPKKESIKYFIINHLPRCP